MLMIRLQRTGRENLPSYRLVVAEKHKPVKGKYIEILGHYLPARNPPVFFIEKERILQWVQKGAAPSDTVARLLKREGFPGLERFIKTYTKKRPKAEAEGEAKIEAKTEGGDTPEKKA